MYVNESLARGLRRSQIVQNYKITEKVSSKIEESINAGRYKLMARFKRSIATFRQELKANIFADELRLDKKRSRYAAVLWQPCSNKRAELVCYDINARTFSADAYHIGTVSAHAIDRLFQRLNTLDLTIAMQELKPAVLNLWDLRQTPPAEWPDLQKMKTKHGHARVIANREIPEFFIATWIKESSRGG